MSAMASSMFWCMPIASYTGFIDQALPLPCTFLFFSLLQSLSPHSAHHAACLTLSIIPAFQLALVKWSVTDKHWYLPACDMQSPKYSNPEAEERHSEGKTDRKWKGWKIRVLIYSSMAVIFSLIWCLMQLSTQYQAVLSLLKFTKPRAKTRAII